MQYVGIDWANRRAAWCAKQADGRIAGEGWASPSETRVAGRLRQATAQPRTGSRQSVLPCRVVQP